MSAGISVGNIVVDIGDLIRQTHNLPLQRGGQLAGGVAQDTVPHLPSQVETVSLVFQPLHHPQGLLIVTEAPGYDLIEYPFSGVSEGRVAQIVAQSGGLGQVLVEPQPPGDGPGDAGDLQRVGHAGTVVVALRLQKYLGLVLEPAERFAVYDAVNVPLKAGAHFAGGDRPLPAPALSGQTGPRRQSGLFQLLGALPDGHRRFLLFLLCIYSAASRKPSFSGQKFVDAGIFSPASKFCYFFGIAL